MFLAASTLKAGIPRGPYDDFWYMPVSSYTASGKLVTANSAMALPAVRACVACVSQSIAALPLVLYRKEADGDRQPATDHPLFPLFALRPNRWQTAFEFWEMASAHLELRGNAYAYIASDSNGAIRELIPLHPDCMKPRVVSTGVMVYEYRQPTDGTVVVYQPGEIMHLRGASSDGYIGTSTIQEQRELFAYADAARSYGSSYFANNAAVGQFITSPGSFKDEAERAKFREAWQAAQAGANRWKTPVLDKGMELKSIGVTADDAKFIDAAKYTAEDIARIFRVPPHKIGILDRATFSNIEQQALEFVTDCLSPRLVRIEQRIAADLLPDTGELFVEFNVDALLRGDSQARANFYSRGILDGWLTRNEARRRENMQQLDGLDEPLVPLNMVSADALDDGQDDETNDPPQPGGKQPPQPPRALAVALAAADRVIRKESNLPAGDIASADHALFVQDVLALDEPQLAAWWSSVRAGHRFTRDELARLALGLGD